MEPGRLQSMGSQRLRHDQVTNTHTYTLPQEIHVCVCIYIYTHTHTQTYITKLEKLLHLDPVWSTSWKIHK